MPNLNKNPIKQLSQDETQAHLAALAMENPPLESFAYYDDAHQIAYDWHSHPHHQLLYAVEGVLRLETAQKLFLLPPQRAVWIPAGVLHRTILNRVNSCSVFFRPALVPTDIHDVRVINAMPIVREMVRFAMRWTQYRDANDALANAYFQTLGLLCAEWIQQELPFYLPINHASFLKTAIEWTLNNLENATLEQAAKSVHYSPRHFSRCFKQAMGIEWRQFRLQARLLKAMELLIEPRIQIAQVAYRVGFNNLSAFAKAFALFVGESPSAYRARAQGKMPIEI